MRMNIGPRKTAPAYVPFLAIGAVLACSALYRALIFTGFTNDHHMHLAWAQQTLRGELPGRDFVEPGMPLTIALSAAAQHLMGRGILPEFVLCLVFIVAAAGLTYWLGTRLTGSPVLGLIAAALQLASLPRLYNYPKLFIPVVAVLLIWRYIEHPTVWRAAAMGAWAAVAFLFRHDYLVYLAVPALVALVCHLPRSGTQTTARHVGAWAAAAIVPVLPYLVALQFLGGIGPHFRDGLEFARSEQYQWNMTLPRFAVAPPPAVPSRADLGPAGAARRIARAVVLDGVLFVGPVVNWENAGAAMFYGAFMLPAALIVAIGIAALRRHPHVLRPNEIQVLTLAVLSLILALAFVRHPFQARLPDVAGTMPLIAVASAAAVRHRGTGLRVCGMALVTVALVAVCVQGRVWNQLYGAGVFRAPGAFVSRIDTLPAKLRTWPWEALWSPGTLPASVRYLHACTAPDDRVLVTWFAPEMFTFAERGFAAGHPFFTRTHFLSAHYQNAMLERLTHQRVPVALINLEQPWFTARYSALDGYLKEHYAVIDTHNYNGADIAIAVRKDLPPSGVFAPTGWPCFRQTSSPSR